MSGTARIFEEHSSAHCRTHFVALACLRFLLHALRLSIDAFQKILDGIRLKANSEAVKKIEISTGFVPHSSLILIKSFPKSWFYTSYMALVVARQVPAGSIQQHDEAFHT